MLNISERSPCTVCEDLPTGEQCQKIYSCPILDRHKTNYFRYVNDTNRNTDSISTPHNVLK